MHKYVRTPHLETSRLQPGDSTEGQVRWQDLDGAWIVIEEKVDGANTGFSNPDGRPALQSRGHYLVGGASEARFSTLKMWHGRHAEDIAVLVDERYVVYGECPQVKHTVFYDRLPHVFMEFDVLDTKTDSFLSTAERRRLFDGLPIVPVPVLYAGPAPKRLEDALTLAGIPSTCMSDDEGIWSSALERQAERAGHDVDRAWRETGPFGQMEGLYIKVERGGETVGRMKWVAPWFLQKILDSGSHHRDRRLIENVLAPDVDLMAETVTWSLPGLSEIPDAGSASAVRVDIPEALQRRRRVAP